MSELEIDELRLSLPIGHDQDCEREIGTPPNGLGPAINAHGVVVLPLNPFEAHANRNPREH